MSTRSVRLDSEAELALKDIVEKQGISISEAIKQGLIEYREKSSQLTPKRPSDFFKEFDLGEGAYAIAPARDTKLAVKEKLTQQNHRN